MDQGNFKKIVIYGSSRSSKSKIPFTTANQGKFICNMVKKTCLRVENAKAVLYL